MTNTIQQKRSLGSIAPPTLAEGQLAYTFGDNKLYIGAPGSTIRELPGAAALSKLAGIETGADITDATNVSNAGAVMRTDTDVSTMDFFLDEDAMGSNSATKGATQQSIKAYVDNLLSSGVSYEGGYNAAANVPNLQSTPVGIKKGMLYAVEVAGAFFTKTLEVGDTILAEQNDPTLEVHWTIINRNLDDASIKVAYENNADTNNFNDAAVTKLAGIETGADVTDVANVTGTGAVMSTQYDANSVLVSVIDNSPTPAVLLSGEFVGRPTGGSVGAVTRAQALSMLNVAEGAAPNYALVSQAVAEAGISTTLVTYTPQRVTQQIAAATIDGGTF
jgi:hypothetical protein